METGQYFDCPADRFILDAAHAANILIAYSCRSGQCGSCLGKILEGQVAYPGGTPDALIPEELDAGYVLFCSAQPRSNLLIKLRSRGEVSF